ncbi:hypothetical protein RZS08_38380, partial [Arthrospira platensis SPKY1]|nr:hypothetical protein [Arthrospira platensis SPKY1]
MDRKIAVINFGRFQPPHAGHEVLFDFIEKKSRQLNADGFIFVSPKTFKPDNPLSYIDKIRYLQSGLSSGVRKML